MRKELKNINENREISFNFHDIQFDLQKKHLESDALSILENSNIESFTKNDITENIRFFELEKFVYEKDIKISYKLKSVFSALHSVKSSVIMKIVSNGKECRILIGVKSIDKISEKANVLEGALQGNFPGTSFKARRKDVCTLNSDEILKINNSVFIDSCKEITAVVGIPSLKDKEEEQFIQGIENLILGMNGKPFTALFIADPIASQQVELTIDTYEQIASVLSKDKEFVVTKGENASITESLSFSNSSSSSTTISTTEGTNESTTTNSSPWIGQKLLNTVFGTGSKNAKFLGDKLVKGVEIGIVAGAAIGGNTLAGPVGAAAGLKAGAELGKKLDLKTKTEGSKTKGTSHSVTKGTSESTTNSTTKGTSDTTGTSLSEQRTFTNKKVANFLDRLDKQVERLEQGKGTGFWNVGAFFIAEDSQNSVIAANIYNGVIKGEESNFETSVIKTFNSLNDREKNNVINYLKRYEIPQLDNGGYLAQAVTTDELTVQINFPHKSVVGLDVVEITPFGNNPNVKLTGKRYIKIGSLYNYDKIFSNEITLDIDKLTSHIFVTGSTGSGKSNVTYNLIDKLSDKNIKFLVIEPAKGEYKEEFGGREDVKVYGTNTIYTELLRINPFAFPDNIHVYEHIDRFIEILNACWPMEAAMPNLLKEAVEDAYISKGWLLDESRCINEPVEYPLFSDLLKSLENVIENSKFSQEVKSNYEGALVSRVRSMTNGLNKLIFTNNYIKDKELFDENVVVDLSRVASSEGKSLFMGILFMKLNEYRIATKENSNSELKHITIIEEAHNLLKRTSSEQSADSSNLAGKSVEMISNAIAEMRTYGEGFVIADQAPGLLDMSVIRNTNTKICLRLPDFEDRKLVGNAMNLTENQIKELASLETGVAAIYQNDWQEALLCKFDKFEGKQIVFKHKEKPTKNGDVKKVLEIISKYEKEKTIKNEDVEFINETIALDFLLKQKWDESKSSNFLKIELTKVLMKITSLDRQEVQLILKYIVHLLKRKNYKSKLVNIKIN